MERFRNMEEARRALWVAPDDPSLPRRIRRLWAFAKRLTPSFAPRGLRKFRSIEEANLERERWVAERIRALHESRKND